MGDQIKSASGKVRAKVNGDEVALILKPRERDAILRDISAFARPDTAEVRSVLRQVKVIANGQG